MASEWTADDSRDAREVIASATAAGESAGWCRRMTKALAEIDRLVELLAKTVDVGLPYWSCGTECLGTCPRCENLQTVRAALARHGRTP